MLLALWVPKNRVLGIGVVSPVGIPLGLQNLGLIDASDNRFPL